MRLLFLLLLMFAGVPMMSAQGPSLESLIDNSPFVPENFRENVPTPPPRPPSRPSPEARTLEFRGMFTLNGTTKVNIFDLRTQRGQWFRPDDPNAEFRVTNLDEDGPSVTLDINGEPIVLSMKKPSENPLPVVIAEPEATPQPVRRPTRFGQQNPNDNQPDAPRPVLRRRIVPRNEDGSPANQTNSPADRAPPPRTVEELMQTIQSQNQNNP